MDDRRWLLAAALGFGSAALLLTVARRARRRDGDAAATETVETAEATWMPEATLVAVLSLLIDALGPKETCRLRCLCPSATVSHQELRQGWTEELCLAKLATSEGLSDVPAALRRAVAVAALAGRSPDLWLPDTLGRPALVVAACSRPKAKSQELLKALLSQKAQPEARSPDGWNALMWSAQRGNCEDCRLLLQARANANAVSADGTSPLLCAVRADVAPLQVRESSQKMQVVKLLLSSRADPALVPMQSPFDEYVDMDVREALASAPKQR